MCEAVTSTWTVAAETEFAADECSQSRTLEIFLDQVRPAFHQVRASAFHLLSPLRNAIAASMNMDSEASSSRPPREAEA
jgi:hypothetical protein